jgi:RNA polymerase sigma-70 factor (ECF subfamily)
LFQEIILPHLDAAHNLARWLTRNDVDAQDVVQESYLRAFRFFDSYKGGDSKAWLLAIVRNTSHTWRRRQNRETEAVPFDEAAHSGEGRAPNQEESLVRGEKIGVLKGCIEALPIDFREVLIMRELEEMSYQEIAEVTALPLGTVMSRLSRARKRLEECAANRAMGAAG